MPQTALPKTKREWRASYVKIKPPAATEAIWYRLLRDTDDASREYAWEENDTTNVWGEAVSTNRVSGQSISIDPFFTRKGDPMTLLLYDFDARQADLDDVLVEYGEAVVDLDAGEVIYAFTRPAYILIQSTGGASSDADAIPFNVKLVGKPTEADFDIESETFTAVTAP